MATYSTNNYPLQKETELIIGIAYEIHRVLGKGFLEIVYKDALEHELNEKGIVYAREKEFPIHYKNRILPHKFYADFVVLNAIILEVKSQEGIADKQVAQTINYLKVSGCKVGLIINFGEISLKLKRLVL